MLVNGNYQDGTVGGTQTFTQNLAVWLGAAGHQVAVLCQGDRDGTESIDGIDVFRIRPPHVSVDPEPYWAYLVNQSLAIQNPAVAGKVRAVVRQFRPDLCHVQMLRRLTPAVLTVLLRHRAAVVQTVHEPFSLWNFNAYQRRDSPDKLYSRRPWTVGLLKARHRVLSRRVDHVCAPSRVALQPYARDGYFTGVPASLIPNAVPHEWGDPAALAGHRSTARPGSDVRFLFVGRLDHYKGVGTMLRALQNLPAPDIRLDVAGEGVLADAVRSAAVSDSRITFHGPVQGDRRCQLLREADVLLCPSTWDEPFGLVVLEAYAAGLPVIASRAGALPELVEHGVTGLLADSASSTALRQAMQQVVSAQVRHELAAGAASRASAYHPDEFLRRQLAVYHAALATKERK
jgi:glycosyltransferase involved in cell wall biosynthesis